MARASRTLTAMEPTARALAWLLPSTFFLAVLSGISTVSSWSWPKVVWPLRSSTPITPKGTFLIRMTWPSGSPSPKRLPTTVWPMSATLAAPSTSSWLKRRPSVTSHSRAMKNSPVTPCTLVAQLRLP
jgi:hypothetical protein